MKYGPHKFLSKRSKASLYGWAKQGYDLYDYWLRHVRPKLYWLDYDDDICCYDEGAEYEEFYRDILRYPLDEYEDRLYEQKMQEALELSYLECGS